MDFCLEKISASAESKSFYIEICAIGKRSHEETSCKEDDCQTKQFIGSLEELIENIKSDEANFVERAKFIDISTKNIKKFLVCDQLLKKFGAEFFHLEDYDFKMAVYFKTAKVNSYIKNIEEIKLLKAKNLVVEKAFL